MNIWKNMFYKNIITKTWPKKLMRLTKLKTKTLAMTIRFWEFANEKCKWLCKGRCAETEKATFGDFCEVPFVFGPLLNWVLNVIIHMNERVKSHPSMSRLRVLKTKNTPSKNRKKTTTKRTKKRCPPNWNDLRFPKNRVLYLVPCTKIGVGFIEICKSI